MGFSDSIRIRELSVDCVVGVYPDERDTSQPLLVDVEMCLDTDEAATAERLRASVDYAAAAAQVSFLLQSCRFRMLETAAQVLCRYLLLPPSAGERRAQIDRVRVCLSKPGALDGRAVASLEMERDAGWAQFRSEAPAFGTVDVVYETRSAVILRVNLTPGACASLPLNQLAPRARVRQSEMVLTQGLLCQGSSVCVGSIRRWPGDTAHSYANPTNHYQTLVHVVASS